VLLIERVFTTRISHIVLLAVAYIVFARIGQVFAIPPGNISAVWIPSGIVLAAILMKGNYLWPGIFVGAFLGNIWAYYDFSTADNIARSLVSATSNGIGDSVAAILGASFIKRITGSSYPFSKGSDVLAFVLYGAILGGGISAVFGVTSLSLMGFVDWDEYVTVLITWWVGDGAGVLLITPVLLVFSHWRDWQWLTVRSGCELLLFYVAILLLIFLRVEGDIVSTSTTLPVILLLPLLMWSVFRFPDHVTFLAIVIMSALIIIAKANFFSFNTSGITNVSIVELQLCLSIISVTVLILVANKKNKDQIEEFLETANGYNRTLFEELSLGLVLCDMDGKLQDVNPAYAAIIGRSIEETIALSYWDITPEKYSQKESEQLKDLEENGCYGPYEKEFIHKDGRHISVVLRGRVIVLDEVQYILSSVEDISEEKQVEGKLLAIENRYQALFDSAKEAVIITDKDGVVFGVNRSAEILFGYNTGDIVGKNVRVLVPDFIQSSHDGYINDFHSTGGSQVTGVGRDVDGRRKDGTLFPVHIAIGQYREEQGVSFMAIVRDLSNEKKHHESLKREAENAIKANHAKSDFLSSMSHELRTPLNAIIGFSQLLEMGKDNLSKDQLVSVNEIQRGGKHLLTLINEILDLSKIESGKVTINMQDVNLTRIVEECLRLTSSQAEEHGVVVTVAKNTDFKLRCDPFRFKQILLNYLSNAIKYNKPSGTASITFQETIHAVTMQDCLRIIVSDTGQGLSEKHMASLFSPFERGDAERGAVQGTGIGLAISKKLALLMAGDVGVSSTLGEGSTFWVDILLADIAVVSKGSGVKKRSLSTTKLVTQKTLESTEAAKVLYIEDNEGNILFIKQAFKLYSDSYSLQACSNPHQGLALAIEEPPDLILLDISMPGMDGFEVLKHLRKDKATRKVPVIAISANAMEADVEKGVLAGFDGYLCKPVNISTLMDTMDGILID